MLKETSLFENSEWKTVRPHVRVKRYPIYTKNCPKRKPYEFFYYKSNILQLAKNVDQYIWATLLRKNCWQDLTKIAQSGLTVIRAFRQRRAVVNF